MKHKYSLVVKRKPTISLETDTAVIHYHSAIIMLLSIHLSIYAFYIVTYFFLSFVCVILCVCVIMCYCHCVVSVSLHYFRARLLHDVKHNITACTIVQAVVKATSQSNGKGQILTPWGSETPERITM